MKKRISRIISLALVLVMALSLFAGCGSTDAGQSPDPNSSGATGNSGNSGNSSNSGTANTTDDRVLKLQWLQQTGINSIFEDPWIDLQSLYPYMVFEALVAKEPQNNGYAGMLASDWTISADGLTYTFTLREGVKWHDGEDFTADDVLFTMNTELRNPTAKGWLLQKVEGYQDVVDGNATELTGLSANGNVVTFKLTVADSNFLDYISAAYILPEHLLSGVDAAEISTYEAFWTKPVGTGQYVIDQVSFPDYFTAVANENYWGEKAGIQNVQFVSYDAGGSDAVVAALITGDLDFAMGAAVNDMAVANNIIAQNSDVVAKIKASGYTRFFAFNLTQRADGNNKADLSNPVVRQAFNLIIDQNTIADFYSGQAVGLSTFANPANSQYNDDIPAATKDIATAVEMLKEANFDFSQTIDIAYYYDDQTTHDIMALIRQDFAEAGINVETTLLSGDLATLIYTDANYDMIYLASGGSRPCDLYQLLMTTSAYSFIGEVEERGELFNDLVLAYQAATDPAEAKEIANQLQVLDYQYRYFIPAYALNTVNVYNSAKVSIPDDIFEIDGCSNWRFEEWSWVD